MHRILHLDDNVDCLDAYRITLESDFEVISVSEEREFRTLLIAEKFDVFLIDIHMPSFNGSQAVQLIRASSSNEAIIFILSGDTKLETRLDYHRDGINDFISKEIGSEELILKLRNHLNYKKNFVQMDKGNLTLNKSLLSVTISELPIALTMIEYKLLNFLIDHEKDIVPREHILSSVWEGDYVTQNVLNTHLSNLKGKLIAWDHELETIRYKGIFIRRK